MSHSASISHTLAQKVAAASSMQSSNSRPTLLDFIAQRDRYYPIYTSLSSYLGIAEIVALTRTCKKLSNLYQELQPTWDVDRDLRQFVEDHCGFREQLGRHNAIVSGDFAHYFFKRETWKTSKMDVLIERGDSVIAFIQYLLQAERYQIQSFNDEPIGYCEDSVRITTFQHLKMNVN